MLRNRGNNDASNPGVRWIFGLFRRQDGFTLVELLVALALSGIVMAAIYKASATQQRVSIAQDQVAEMQQEARAALDMIVHWVQLAGYDPRSSGGFLFQLPGAEDGRCVTRDGIAFFVDDDGNGTVDDSDSEQIGFRLNIEQDGTEREEPDMVLRKFSSGAVTWQPVAENVEAIGFAYAYDADGDGQLDTIGGNTAWAIDTTDPPDGELDVNLDTNNDGEVDANDEEDGVALGATVPISDVRAVKIWILVRARLPDRDFSNTGAYVVANRRITVNDHFRRRLLSTTVKCRNLGLH